jgi:hypothetical protein
MLSSETSDISEDSPGTFSWLPSFLVDYHTSKIVVLKSPYLQVPHACLQILIIFYIVVYSLAYKLRFMGSEEVYSDADIALLKPMSNWLACTNSDFDCNLHVHASNTLAYCNNHTPFGIVFKHNVEHQRRVERCWQSDIHVTPGSKILVPTLISHLYQTWNTTQGDWMNDDLKEYYMQDIESFTLRFSHSFVTSLGVSRASMDMNGILESEAQKYKFAQGKLLKEYQEKHNVPDPWSTIPELEECGTEPSIDQTDSCSRTIWGNVISVKQLLNFVGIESLDNVREGMHGATYRQSGLGVNAYIDYRNDASVWDLFFFHGFSLSDLLGPPPFYRMEIKHEPLGKNFITNAEVTHPTKDGQIDLNKRLVQQQTGILVRVSSGGKILFGSARQFLLSAVSAVALLAVANLFVEKGLVKIYRKCAGMQHVSALYHVHKNESSKTEMEFLHRLEELQVEDPEAYHHLVNDDVVSELHRKESKGHHEPHDDE